MSPRPSQPPGADARAGDTQDVAGAAGVAALIERVGAGSETGALEVDGGPGGTAQLSFASGRLVAARSGTRRGSEAALRIFLWTELRARWRPGGRPAGAPNADHEAAELLTEGLRRRAVWQRMRRELPEPGDLFTVDFAALARGVAELPPPAQDLCRLFDGRRTFSDVLRDATLPELETASIVGHLLTTAVLVPAAALPRVSEILPAVVPEATPPAHDEVPAIGRELDDEATDLVRVRRPPARGLWPLAATGAVVGVIAALLVANRRPASSPPDAVAAKAALAGPPVARRSPPATLAPPLLVLPPTAPPSATAARAPVPAQPAASGRGRALETCDRARQAGQARAVVECEKAVTAGAARADILAWLAQAALERGQFGRAAGRARQALALDPALAEAYAYLGFAEAEAGRNREANAAYRRYLELSPRGRYADDVRAILRARP